MSEEDTSYEALMIALSRTEALEGVMATDTTRARDPSHDVAAPTQIAWCLTLCETAAIEHEDARKGIAFSGEFELALCVYTTYFYAVINRALRDLGAPKDRVIAESIERTYDWLMAGFEAAEAVYIRTFRMELQSEWIKDTGVGATVAFPGFTSTHPTLHGINAMPYDVRNGAFGTVTTPVVLVFEGLCKILLPQTKYFPSETEYILPAGIVMKITKCYKLDWYLMSDDHSAPITVLHLEPMYLIDKKGKRGKCEVSPKMLVTPTPAPEGDFGIAVAENGDFVLYKA
ncbi:MAG: hypothetical protein Q8Q09_25810 [Deltaproteobacteria bacterium]|nr:hypothetical protein [Deltaproteobacteria bacterium]